MKVDSPGLLIGTQTDVPPGDEWLTRSERLVLATIGAGPRRQAWRLGRWLAKSAVGGWLSCAPEEIEVSAAPDGAPEARLKSQRLPIVVSLSHRGDHAIAAVTESPQRVGCDLELIEPRSQAFVREWLAPAEQQLVSSWPTRERPLVTNLIWTAKEAAVKLRRHGLRGDVRALVVSVSNGIESGDGWRRLSVDWGVGNAPTAGWWRVQASWVMTIAAEPAPGVPTRL